MWDVPDEALFAGYASGDAEAAAAFVRRVERKVYGLALAIVQDAADAQDVAQEALVRAWRFAASFDERRGSVMAWLLGITRNVALDTVRGRGRRPEVMEEAPLWVVDPTDVSDVVEHHDEAARVLALMRELPASQREALVAVTLYGLTTREVSEQAAIPHGTVKTRVRLALRKLRDGVGGAGGMSERPSRATARQGASEPRPSGGEREASRRRPSGPVRSTRSGEQ